MKYTLTAALAAFLSGNVAMATTEVLPGDLNRNGLGPDTHLSVCGTRDCEHTDPWASTPPLLAIVCDEDDGEHCKDITFPLLYEKVAVVEGGCTEIEFPYPWQKRRLG